MTKTQTLFLFVLLAALAVSSAAFGALLVSRQASQGDIAVGGATDSVAFTVIGTSSPMTVGSASGRVLATSTESQWRYFQNNSGVGIWLSFGSDKPALVNQGIYLQASSSLAVSLDASNMYRGSVTAITSGGGGTLLVTQK